MFLKKNHPFHLVDIRPWPFFSSIGVFSLVLGIRYWFRTQNCSLFLLGLILTDMIACQWWQNVSWEGGYQGLHTNIVQKGLKMGIVLFIVSEVFFFLSFFWGFFHNRLSPSVEIGLNWPPVGISPFNPFQIPLLNTIVLLSSGVIITWSHHALIENKITVRKLSLFITLLLGVYFTLLQWIEYKEAFFCISDSVFGSRFFLATGFHGIHVLVGSGFIMATMARITKKIISNAHHFGFEAAAWYWHFVDVVWLFLYLSIYWWGG